VETPTILNCKTSDPTQQFCLECFDGYWFNGDSCLGEPHCSSMMSCRNCQGNHCKECKTNYFLASDGKCYERRIKVKNCDIYKTPERDDGLCLICSDRFYSEEWGITLNKYLDKVPKVNLLTEVPTDVNGVNSGECMCSNGQIYSVGEYKNQTGVLACQHGIPGAVVIGVGSNSKVICGGSSICRPGK
jgi:hypothetical protein